MTGPAGALGVDDGGNGGVPVVFLHSLAGNASHWALQLQHLRPTRRAIAMEFRGHGRSEPANDSAYGIDALASDVAAVVDSLKLDRFVLVGHSMGGGVALEYAGAHPERVAAVLFVDPIGNGSQIPAQEAQGFLSGIESNYQTGIEAYWTQIAGPSPAVRDRVLNDLRRTPREAVIGGLRSVFEFDPTPALARFTGPKLSVVTPQNDASFSLHRQGAGFPYRVVAGTGHWIQLDRPDDMNAILDGFLGQLDPAR